MEKFYLLQAQRKGVFSLPRLLGGGRFEPVQLSARGPVGILNPAFYATIDHLT